MSGLCVGHAGWFINHNDHSKYTYMYSQAQKETHWETSHFTRDALLPCRESSRAWLLIPFIYLRL